jgi:hypothetical protein
VLEFLLLSNIRIYVLIFSGCVLVCREGGRKNHIAMKNAPEKAKKIFLPAVRDVPGRGVWEHSSLVRFLLAGGSAI